MLEELKSYINLWSPGYFVELFWLFNNQVQWKIKDIDSHFHNRTIEWNYIFDWCLYLLIKLNILITENWKLRISDQFIPILDYNKKKISKRILKQVFNTWCNDINFLWFFSPEYVSFNQDEMRIEISNSAFKFKYSNFKHFLINIWLLRPNNDWDKYFIDKEYEIFFKNIWVLQISRKILSLEDLKEKILAQELAWEIAELFVIKFETMRLVESKKIVRISEIDVWAGYDILSYEDRYSHYPDRYIEVKSYSWDYPSFHWSRNEINTAKQKNNQYYIYLVNRNKINNPGYSPEIIQNPYNTIFNNENWIKESDWYIFNKI